MEWTIGAFIGMKGMKKHAIRIHADAGRDDLTMVAQFLSADCWKELTATVKKYDKPCDVAVAYFGKGGSALLPLVKGSRLVVDASEQNIRAGQTCPHDLLTLVKRGVSVYSVPNLHAKVYVVGKTAFIGSANVSNRSASQLIETLVRTTDSQVVRLARKFVDELCLYELTPNVIEDLAKIYHPPKIPSGRRSGNKSTTIKSPPELPRVFIAQLEHIDWSKAENAIHNEGLRAAKKQLKNASLYTIDSFKWDGECSFSRNDVIIQITDEDHSKVLVSPPGNVVYIRPHKRGQRKSSFVYLERRADKKRRSLKSIKKRLGAKWAKSLSRQGLVRNNLLAQELLRIWS